MFAEGQVQVEDMPLEAVVDGWRAPADKAYVLIKKVCRNAREDDDETSDDEGD